MVLLSAVCIGSCAFVPFMADLVAPPGSTLLAVDSTGAKAVAGTESQLMSRSKGLDSKALEDNPALVKFLEDGTIASILDFGEESVYIPPVSFISMGDEGSIYVGFENFIWGIWDGTSSIGIQFIRIYPNSSDYDILWPPESSSSSLYPGMIDVWGWWGMEQDPLVKDSDGKLYFTVNESEGDDIYCYDPDAGRKPVKVTPDNSTLRIGTFMIDKKKHLFFQNDSSYGDSASFLRYYTDGGTSYKNVYYSSDSDVWVRGYISSLDGNYVIINGYNIRGMNGIIKVSDLDSETQSYELMYSDSSGGGTWINLYKHYDNNWEGNTELINMTSQSWTGSSFEWRDDVKTGGLVDIDKICAKIQPYFVEKPTIKDAAKESLLIADDLEANDLYDLIANNPEDFLRAYFTGKLFKDWLSEEGLTDLCFGNIGKMIWAKDGALYGLYDNGWWGGGASADTKVVRLLDAAGNRALTAVPFTHAEAKPSMIKIMGDVIYYRYAILDSASQETGFHQLARLTITDQSGPDEELLPSDLQGKIEIISYDVSSDGLQLYFVGANPQTNEIINGKIDIASGDWETIDTTLKFGNIKVIE